MPKPILPTLSDRDFDPRATSVAIKRLHGYTGELEGKIRALEEKVAALPAAPFTLEDILAAVRADQASVEPTDTGGVGGTGGVTPVPPLPVPDLTPQYGAGNVHVVGNVFVDNAGVRWRWLGCTDFYLYYLYQSSGGSAGGGPAAIAPVLADRAARGFTVLRVFSMMWNIVNFTPSAYPAYYDDLPIFAAQLAGVGLNLELTVLVDCQLVPGYFNDTQQEAHLRNCWLKLQSSPNVFIEVGNEASAGNGWTPGHFTRPTGLLSSAGSNGGGVDPPRPAWDYATIHPPRDVEWMRKSKDLMEFRDGPGAPGYVPLNRPCVDDEPMGAAEVAIAGSRSATPNDFYWFAATAMMFGAGASFHSTDGITSVTPFNPIQNLCALAFVAGVMAIPTDAQTWNYTRGGLADHPLTDNAAWYLRAYCKFDSHNAIVVIIQPTGLWPGPTAIAPWVISGYDGASPGGNTLIYLTR